MRFIVYFFCGFMKSQNPSIFFIICGMVSPSVSLYPLFSIITFKQVSYLINSTGSYSDLFSGFWLEHPVSNKADMANSDKQDFTCRPKSRADKREIPTSCFFIYFAVSSSTQPHQLFITYRFVNAPLTKVIFSHRTC